MCLDAGIKDYRINNGGYSECNGFDGDQRCNGCGIGLQLRFQFDKNGRMECLDESQGHQETAVTAEVCTLIHLIRWTFRRRIWLGCIFWIIHMFCNARCDSKWYCNKCIDVLYIWWNEGLHHYERSFTEKFEVNATTSRYVLYKLSTKWQAFRVNLAV